jgi:hypothetical protein
MLIFVDGYFDSSNLWYIKTLALLLFNISAITLSEKIKMKKKI